MDIVGHRTHRRVHFSALTEKGEQWIRMNITTYFGNYTFDIDSEHQFDMLYSMEQAGLEVEIK